MIAEKALASCQSCGGREEGEVHGLSGSGSPALMRTWAHPPGLLGSWPWTYSTTQAFFPREGWERLKLLSTCAGVYGGP